MKKSPPVKPAKPRPDFPLFPHDTRRWAKKIRGKLHYFGPWDDPDGALAKYLDQKEDLQAGRTPKRCHDTRPTVKDLCNLFLAAKEEGVKTGELSIRTYQSYKVATDQLIAHFGRSKIVEDVSIQDFADLRARLAKVGGLVTLGNLVQRCRIVFKFAYDTELVDKPIRVGPAFKRPAKAKVRAEKQAKPTKIYQADQIRVLLDAAEAKPQLRAMILLGINCAFGQTDLSMLTIKSLDLKGGWVDFPRPKTAIERRCKLWPETVDALKVVLRQRRQPTDPQFEDRVFVNKLGVEYVRTKPNGVNLDGISLEFNKLRTKCKLTGRHLAFYTLRHTFETIGGESERQIAVDWIMGHAPASDDMSAEYRKFVGDDRLKAVTDHVRKWLWPECTQVRSF